MGIWMPEDEGTIKIKGKLYHYMFQESCAKEYFVLRQKTRAGVILSIEIRSDHPAWYGLHDWTRKGILLFVEENFTKLKESGYKEWK